jgi:hypothetical protein
VLPVTSAVTIVPNNSNLRAQESPKRTPAKVPFRTAGHEFTDATGQGVSAICAEKKKNKAEKETSQVVFADAIVH